jgi:chromosome segregation ATPase
MTFAHDAAVRATEDLDGRLDVAEEELSEARATIERLRTDMTALRASEVAAVARASKLALDLQTAQSEAAEARRDVRHRDETIASLRLTVRETSSACQTLVERCERAESARDESRTAQKESLVKMLRHRDALAALLRTVRRERAEREAWLVSLPGGSCGNPPPAALVAAEAATGEMLRAMEEGR